MGEGRGKERFLSVPAECLHQLERCGVSVCLSLCVCVSVHVSVGTGSFSTIASSRGLLSGGTRPRLAYPYDVCLEVFGFSVILLLVQSSELRALLSKTRCEADAISLHPGAAHS